MLDLICMGRAAVDLYSEQIGCSLEEAKTFAKYVGGCPANIAIGAGRLGLKTGILSRVGNEAMGRFVRQTFEEEGVDTSLLHTDPDRLTALVLLGIVPPDHFPLIFYRENCADMAIEKEDFTLAAFQNTKSLLITGTHCSNDRIFSVTCCAVDLAVQAGAKIILDIDYRPVLWNMTGHGDGEERYVATEKVAKKLQTILPKCDLIVGTDEEILIAGGLEQIRKQSNATIVQKRGEKGCLVYPPKQQNPITGQPFPVTILNVLGAGDAFMSGFLRGYLRDLPLEECAKLGNANGALVVTRHGCSPAMPFWSELQYFIQNPKNLNTVERLHERELFVLAFDHRCHFEELANHSEDKIKKCKSLIFDALPPDAGMIADPQYSLTLLQKTGSRFAAQCVEQSGKFPLEFLANKEPSDFLESIPKEQVVKVLCHVSDVGEKQIKKLKQLHSAAASTGHALLIELIDKNSEDLTKIAAMIEQCYTENIFPAWWKLPAFDQPDLWQKIDACIEKQDPNCLGVLLLGANKPLASLAETFRQVKKHSKKIKGFAVGRSVWDAPARAWMEDRISNEEFVQSVARNFSTLIHAWRSPYDGNKRNPEPANFFVQDDRTHSRTGGHPLSCQSKK